MSTTIAPPVDDPPPTSTIGRKRKARPRRGCLTTVFRLALTVFVLALIVPLLRAGVECRLRGGGVAPEMPPDPAPASIQSIKDALPGYKRAEEQTFLTYPEWYIVYSADEYAAFIAKNPPSQFPYFAAVSQYWNGYYDVCAVTRGRYPYNDYHMMLGVIGVSFTAENIVKGVYENTIGRLTELISTPALTEEDAYARVVAREYGALTHRVPWFEFPFVETLQGLWQKIPLTGPNLIRKWERRLVLSAEYGIKAGYGKVLKAATQAAYGDDEDLRLQVWLKGISPATLAKLPDVKVVKEFDGSLIVSIPRYDAFTQAATELALSKAQFIELAGNDDVMLVVIAPRDWAYDLPAGQVLFEMPVLINTNLKRIAIKAPVAALSQILLDLNAHEYRVERIYDY